MAGISGAVAVGAGALGAHALNGLPQQEMALFNTAQQGHIIHSLALLGAGLLVRQYENSANRRALLAARVAAALFAGGILLFSGGLYLKALSTIQILDPLIPLGGWSFILGWLAVAASAIRQPNA